VGEVEDRFDFRCHVRARNIVNKMGISEFRPNVGGGLQ